MSILFTLYQPCSHDNAGVIIGANDDDLVMTRRLVREAAQRRRNCGRGIGGGAEASLWRKLIRPFERS